MWSVLALDTTGRVLDTGVDLDLGLKIVVEESGQCSMDEQTGCKTGCRGTGLVVVGIAEHDSMLKTE